MCSHGNIQRKLGLNNIFKKQSSRDVSSRKTENKCCDVPGLLFSQCTSCANFINSSKQIGGSKSSGWGEVGMLQPGLRLPHLAILFLMMGVSPEVPYGPRVISCWKNWLKMTDDNYLRALERYDNCGKLVGELEGDTREKYKKSLVNNLQRSSNYFFDHTEMSPAEVIRVLRSANQLMETWTTPKIPSEAVFLPRGSAGSMPRLLDGVTKGKKERTNQNAGYECNYATLCPSCDTEPSCNEEEEEEEDPEPCSNKAVSLFWWTRFLLYAFIALIVLQSIILLIMFCKVCCTDLLTHFPSCAYETQCCCEEDKEWITKLINECETHLANKQECFPLLLDTPQRKYKSSTAVGYGTNIGKRGNRDDDILMDLTPLSSPRIGSDSEFEALMNRRSLQKQ